MLALKLGNSIVSNFNTSSNQYAISLNGTDEYVSGDSVTSDMSTSEGTYSVWVKVGAHSANGFIMQSRNDADNQIQMFFHNSTNQVRFIYKGGGTATVIAISDNIALRIGSVIKYYTITNRDTIFYQKEHDEIEIQMDE